MIGVTQSEWQEADGMSHERYHVANLEMPRADATALWFHVHRLNDRPLFGAPIGHVKVLGFRGEQIEDSDRFDVQALLVYRPSGYSEMLYDLEDFGFLEHLPIPNAKDWAESIAIAWQEAT